MNKSFFIFAIASLALCVGLPAQGALNIAPQPLALATGQPPNILLILDNSNSMVEDLDGLVAADCAPPAPADCPVGAVSPLSKSEMIREVGRGLLADYRDQINLGLMAYQQFPLGTGSNNTRLVRVGNRLYDVSYNPADWDPDFPGAPWDSQTKAFRTPNPSSPGEWIHYNIGVPGYSFNDQDTYCYTREPGGGFLTEPFPFRCWRNKTGTSNVVPPDNQGWNPTPNRGYTDGAFATTGTLTDSARARGVTHWGRLMVWLAFERPEWLAQGSPGRGYLHTPIRFLDEEHADALALKLAPVHHDNTNPNLLTDPEEPIIAAGDTPLQGTLLTARDYFLNQTANFGTDQGRRAGVYPIPESCGVDAAIWLTDGMPSRRIDGAGYGADVEAALTDAIAAAESFNQQAGVSVYVVGFSMPPAVPDDALDRLAAAGGTDTPFLANNPAALFEAVNDIFQQVIADSQAQFGTTVSGSVLLDDDLAFRTITDPSDWSGEVEAVSDLTSEEPSVQWRASERLPVNWFARTLITHGGTFNNSNNELVNAIAGQNPSEEDLVYARSIVDYVHGSQAMEQEQGGPFRNRETLIGAIAGSEPLVQRQRNFDWARLPSDEGGGSTYNEFVTEKAGRDPVVYVGSNDGILHAFRAQGQNAGREIFGYVPRGVWPRLEKVALPSPAFVYTMDGKTQIADAQIDGDWATVLVGSLGAGGRSIFALDVTEVGDGNTLPTVLWERTTEDLGAHANDLGYTFSAPQVARLSDGTWVVVVGNGYNSENHDARLLVFDLETGEVLASLLGSAGTSANPNGLSDLRLGFSRPAELHHRWVYAGDLHGNLWRFDLDDLSADGKRVFSGDRPITAAPDISYPVSTGNVGFVVSFGTGKYFEVGDDDATGPDEYFYVIHDLNPEGSEPNFSRDNLVDRSFEGAATGAQAEIEEGSTEKGWFVKLPEGHRVLFAPFVLRDRVIFSSFSPTEDVCVAGGFNDLYVMSLPSGQGAFPLEGLGEYGAVVRNVEGAPARPAVFVRGVTARPEPDDPSDPDDPTDPDDPPEAPSICITIAGDTFCFEDDASREEAADFQFGRRFHWLQTE